MNKILKVDSKEYVQKILSEGKITADEIDYRSVQTYQQFCEYDKPKIQYKADDFLISVDQMKYKKLQEKHVISLHEVDKFGWYYEKIHNSEFQLFKATSPGKYKKLLDSNTSLVVRSFDRYRITYRFQKATNVFIGGFGLCYYIFKDEYDNFFRKIRIHNDQWSIKIDDLDMSEYQILMQLFLFDSPEGRKFETEVLNDKKYEGLRIFNRFIRKSFEYFIYNSYSINEFLDYLNKEFSKTDSLKIFADAFKELNDKYVNKGIEYQTNNPLIQAVKNFINLAKMESADLSQIYKMKKVSKTSVFLLGMLNLGDKIDEQFSFDKFITSIIDLTMEYVVDVKLSGNEVRIYFDSNKIEEDRNDKFTYVEKYISELHEINELCERINHLVEKENILQSVLSATNSIADLNGDLKLLNSLKSDKEKQKDLLQEQIKGLKSLCKLYDMSINTNNEIEALQKVNKNLSEKINKVKAENLKLKEELEFQIEKKEDFEERKTKIENESPELGFEDEKNDENPSRE